jgi:polyisoprenoid-binding protein YceI
MNWNIDPSHAELEFAVKHLMISTVKGRFRTFNGTGTTNPDGTLASVAMQIDAKSLDTNVGPRDDHLRSPDFFDVERHPKLTFASTAIRQKGSDLDIIGDLTIRGVTRSVTLTGEYIAPSTDPWGNSRAALAVGGKISRKDWGLTWNQALELGGVAVGDEVKLRIEAEAVAVPQEQPAVSAA